MNDRIRELIYKSGNGQLYDGKIYPHLGSRTTDDWERFARMIVQDVLNLFGDERISLHYLEKPCCEDSILLLQSKIKDHFDIK